MKDRRDFLKLLGLGATIPIVGVKPAKVNAELVRAELVNAEPIVPKTKVEPSSEYFRKPTCKHPLVFISDTGRLEIGVSECLLNLTYERQPFAIERGVLTELIPGPTTVQGCLTGYIDWYRGDWKILHDPFTFEFTEEKSGLVHSFPGCYYQQWARNAYSSAFDLQFIFEA